MSTPCDVEDLGDLVADEVVHRLGVEPLGEALLDAVDDRQLGGALVALGEEPLRLVEQARVLEGHAHARGEGREEPLVGLGEGLGPDVGHRQDAEDPVPGLDGRAEEGLGARSDPANAVRLVLVRGSEAQGPARLDRDAR